MSDNRRVRGLIRKEFLQILRDPSSIAIAFLMPVFLLLLFGYGLSLDAEHVPLAVVVEKPSAETARFTGMLQQSRYFSPQHFASMRDAELALRMHEVNGIVHLRASFAADLKAERESGIQVIVNGVDANTARMVQGYLGSVWALWLEQRLRAAGQAPVVNIDQRIWYNTAVSSRNYLVPGLIAVTMTLIGALLTALVMAREWERGTMEALMVTPVSMYEVLLGKLIPYFILGMGGMTLSVAMALWLFDVPLRGSAVVLFASAAIFLLAALGMGLAISITARNQFVAGLAAIITTFLPAFMLSGFIFDIASAPLAVQAVTYLVAARYFIAIIQTIFLAGNIWPVILPNAAALLAMAGLFLGIVVARSRKRLD